MDSERTQRIDYNTPGDIEIRIEKAKNELEEMIDLNPEVIMLLDKYGRVVRANRAALDFFEIEDFSLILYKELKELITSSSPEMINSLLTRPEGYQSMTLKEETPSGTKTLKLSVVSSGPSHDFSVLIINDITGESRDAINHEKRYKKEAIKALAGALMHNINQPLTVIMMRAQMLKDAIIQNRVDPAEVRRGLDDVMNLSMRVADLVQAVDNPHDFVTEQYVEGVDILDIRKSSSESNRLSLTCSTMLNVLLETLENRIPGTITHARRCGNLSYKIAELSGLDHRTSEIARQAGFVHDIGKLAISDNVTLKPSSLTEEEFKIMRTHAEFGYHIVRGLVFLEDESKAVRSHHEHYDGSGYPHGISGTQIPAAARIVALADAFEVMISGRPYRQAVSIQMAVAELRKNRGTQFDPEFTDIVLNNALPLYELLLSIE